MSAAAEAPTLLSDPFLQLPTDSTVQVVWFTEFEGTAHQVEYGDEYGELTPENQSQMAQLQVAEVQVAQATTTKLSRTYEDSRSQLQGQVFSEVTLRDIWRHEATITGLTPGDRLPYRVISQRTDGQIVTSQAFTLAPNPPKDRPLKILLTSDHQLKPMTPANLQKVAETVGRVDAVFFAGDLINIPDRASEWFDDARGLAFFPALQGRTRYVMETDDTTTDNTATTYTGAELIQHAPLFPIIGNHEVMGRYIESRYVESQHQPPKPLNEQFERTLPRSLVSQFYGEPEKSTSTADWLADRSYNTKTYEEIFSLPTTQLPNGQQTEQYYAVSFGDVRLVSLYVTQIWRSPLLAPETKGRYRESNADLANPEDWGYGQHIFEPIHKGSVQYEWLAQELASDEFKNAQYKIVMLHHPPHTLGGNVVPAFTDPVKVENRTDDGTLMSVQYEYPKEDDYIIRDLLPLLEQSDTQLVFYGHSHLWNRFVSASGLNFLETSNVGNSYGAHTADNPRWGIPTQEEAKANGLIPFQETYAPTGNPNGLTAVMPTLAPITDDNNNPQPFIASNDITSFSIFDTGTGTVISYYFDTREPNAAVVKFDEFEVDSRRAAATVNTLDNTPVKSSHETSPSEG
ncbi:MAG: fibronectin type III domain-containing protein [Cyanobacteria bacterium P01_D01_bin.105]